ncbi:DUF2225 domain-containing protein, partial [Clostridium perfringens]|uniref:DUF2225 domain-containing protein n=1 Tax=Clostridium perfringens TaxID=1502 RepID=UPI002AC38035
MINSSKSISAKDSVKENDNIIINNLFFKEVICPVCENSFKTPTVKVNTPRVTSRDSDFFIRYSVVNPYLYEILLCPSCGYSALRT